MIEFLTFENGAALLTLTVLEIVLGIDNVVFIAILAAKLPEHQRDKARQIGLMLAMGVRVMLLLSISWIMGLQEPLFTLFGHTFSGRDLVLLIGGGFLIYKATHEIHDKMEGSHETLHQPAAAKFGSVVTQIILLDIVFSLDSVITAVGMVKQDPAHPWHGISIMIAAIVIAIGVMLLFSGKIASFIERHPTTKMLALSFLLMIGLVLVAEGFHQHIEKGYVYTAMAFSIFVELLNLRVNKKPSRH
jgi:predicted tellurium resistance membrane protein TerC